MSTVVDLSTAVGLSTVVEPDLPLLQASALSVHFPVTVPGRWRSQRQILKAVDAIDLSLRAGETLAIVGESGCGKSTLARTLVGLTAPTSGSLFWCGEPLIEQGVRRRPWPHQAIQMIFQDPLASLDPRMTLFKLIAQPLRLHAPHLDSKAVARRVHEMMAQVGLPAQAVNRYPHEFSGGQCQRIGIARALIGSPRVLICDEPVAALDVSIRAQIINLLMDLQQAHGLALIFIAHDLAVVRHIADRVAVMYLGRVMEQASSQALFAAPVHPYSRLLLDAVPVPDPDASRRRQPRVRLGELPSPLAPPSGCAFHARCPQARDRCTHAPPHWHDLYGDGSHGLRCIAPNSPHVTGITL